MLQTSLRGALTLQRAMSRLDSGILLLRPPLALLPVVGERHMAKKAAKKAKGKAGGKGKAVAAANDDGDGDNRPEFDIESVKEQMDKAFAYLKREYAAMQTGRATPTSLDSVKVDPGGGEVPLPSLAKVLAQGPQTLHVSCYDSGNVAAVVAAIERHPGTGLRAEQTGKVIKVTLPRPTQESRQSLAKHVKLLAEGAKTAIRSARQRAMKTAKGHSDIKDDVKRAEKEVEDATKAAVDQVEKAAKDKEKEVLTV